MLTGCPREKEIGELLRRGQWPQASAPELRAHVDVCRACGDLVLVAGVFQQARAETVAAAQASSARFGSAGALWWRAQLRRRNEAIERIGRPLVTAQIFALVVSLLAAFGFAGLEARHGIGWLNWLEGLPQAATVRLADISSSGFLNSGWAWMLLAATATLALVGGFLVYFAAERQ
jgi:hypothetical protein